MPRSIDPIMEQASHALADMDYLACEAYCRKALDLARGAEQWDDYTRILMPMQEAHRQRRIIAADGAIRLGTADLTTPAAHWLENIEAGCVVLTHPHSAEDARALADAAGKHHRYIEVLFADNPPEDETWRLRTFHGPDVCCARHAPPAAWINQWLAPGEIPTAATATSAAAIAAIPASPADWFLDAAEALGGEALARAEADPDAAVGSLARIEKLQAVLQVMTDHEMLYQRLIEAARARRYAPA